MGRLKTPIPVSGYRESASKCLRELNIHLELRWSQGSDQILRVHIERGETVKHVSFIATHSCHFRRTTVLLIPTHMSAFLFLSLRDIFDMESLILAHVDGAK